MSDPKDSPSFFRKMVKFVANPATDWADLTSRGEDVRESEYAKSELKAMIERKRRNDFVRKREFDMLRKVRREGLTSEQLASLGGSSRLDDSEGRLADSGAKAERGVKAKIDEIEQQMVGDNFAPSPPRRNTGFYEAPTQPASISGVSRDTSAAPLGATRPAGAPSWNAPTQEARMESANGQAASAASGARPPSASGGQSAGQNARAYSPTEAAPLSGFMPGNFNLGSTDFAHPFAVEVSEVAHDPDLDEAVIAFANADFELCEESLSSLTAPGGSRADHAETWLVLFDLYRAVGEQPKFEALALQYANQFGWSAPQWFSMPLQVAESTAHQRPAGMRSNGQIGWACPAVVDADVVARLRSLTLQMPLPWVFDWSPLESIDAEGSARLSELFRHWSQEPLDMRWLATERLLLVLQEAAPTGVKDVDPAYWQLRLDTLRLANRPDHFDEAAIDYCVTYEVSPPSWERAQCKVRLVSSSNHSSVPSASTVSELSTAFVESTQADDSPAALVSHVELSGQLVGDISTLLTELATQLGASPVVKVECGRLIRVDFLAAGDLLNWVLVRRNENRTVEFEESHRLVALFFGAMGINEHAKVKVRTL
ncbi:MAG: hypothetical protein JWP52_566 [Rhizobacter sp.]|nr:hypothetical protein [Rhizobacter sp.]